MTTLFVNACMRGEDSRTLALCRESVSYTHLDVYKRQVLVHERVDDALLVRIAHHRVVRHGEEGLHGVGPVSYTHLDVYKRQVCAHGRTPAG